MEGDRERAMTLALLALRADSAPGGERSSHLELLRQLQLSSPLSPAAAALEAQRFERFLRAPRAGGETGERRAQLRARCRDRWRASARGLEPEQVRKHLPAQFRTEHAAAEDAGAQQQPLAEESSEMMEVDTGFEPWTASQEEAKVNAVPQIQPARRAPPAPVAPSARSAQPAPAPALGSLFRKKAPLPHEMLDDYEETSTGFSNGVHLPPRASLPPAAFSGPANAISHGQRAPPSNNPFQTAGERLQHDRMTGRAKEMDDDRGGRDGGGRGRSLAGREPATRGGYHPINPKVLLGGKREYGYDDEDNGYGNDGHLAGRVSSAVNKKFVSPTMDGSGGGGGGGSKKNQEKEPPVDDPDIDPRLKSCDPDLIAKIEMEIVDYGDPVAFDDIAGLQFAKKCVNELVIWPMARPDIFTGLRALPKGLLLFGPPGTGKTLIGKAIANQSGATFFSISASSLTSKWIGEGEKLVRTLFAVAAVKQPSVIFIDEIDSLLTQRSSEENEASRRMKTEFLVQLDGAGTKATDVILVVGATNRPQELDEAARRRFVKRLYIPLPSFEARLDLVNRLLKNNRHELSDENLKFVADSTKGYSGADVRALCTEAAMGPIRSCADIRTMDANDVRPIKLEDFVAALRGVRSSVAVKDLDFYREWNEEFGSFPFESHEED